MVDRLNTMRTQGQERSGCVRGERAPLTAAGNLLPGVMMDNKCLNHDLISMGHLASSPLDMRR